MTDKQKPPHPSTLQRWKEKDWIYRNKDNTDVRVTWARCTGWTPIPVLRRVK